MRVASGSHDKTARIWEVDTGKPYLTLEGYTEPVTSVSFMHGRGRSQIVTASCEKVVWIWGYQAAWEKLLSDRPTGSNTAMRVIMVFYPQPIRDIALKNKGLTFQTTTPEEQLEKLDYEYLVQTTKEHIMSFVDTPIPDYGPFIPEIVHSGLGLGYNVRQRTAVNPKDGSPIKDRDVLLASRLDRAMIEVSLQLRRRYPQIVFSSCTRLSDVYLRDLEYTADLQTGSLKERPTTEEGIQGRLRALHGGLYPQSDLVVADDPLAEIAARTWIDEYAQLDRARLLTMTYDEWLFKAPPEVKEAVDVLNGRFLPNTVGETASSNRDQESIVQAIEPNLTQEQNKEEGKRRWWKR
jgi:hypothetical protein